LADRATKFLPGLIAENHPGPDGRLLTGQAYLALGHAYRIRRDVQAADAYARGLAIFQQLTADFPNDARFRQQRDRAKADIYLAADRNAELVDRSRFDSKEAVQVYDVSLAIIQQCGPALDPVLTQTLEARVQLFRAQLLRQLGEIKEVEEACTVGLAASAKLLAARPTNVFLGQYESFQAQLLILRGLSRADAGKTEPAAADFREALTVVGGFTPKDRRTLLRSRSTPLAKSVDQAVQWIDKNKPADEELRRIRAEAAALLDAEQKKKQ
jgi:hypothetical protein